MLSRYHIDDIFVFNFRKSQFFSEYTVGFPLPSCEVPILLRYAIKNRQINN